MNRRLFIKFLLSLGLGAYFPNLAKAAQVETLHEPQDGFKQLEVKFLRQIVTKDSRTSRVIMWQSDEILSGVKVEYKLAGETSAYFCALENLKSESLYNFRIIEDGAAINR